MTIAEASFGKSSKGQIRLRDFRKPLPNKVQLVENDPHKKARYEKSIIDTGN